MELANHDCNGSGGKGRDPGGFSLLVVAVLATERPPLSVGGTRWVQPSNGGSMDVTFFFCPFSELSAGVGVWEPVHTCACGDQRHWRPELMLGDFVGWGLPAACGDVCIARRIPQISKVQCETFWK